MAADLGGETANTEALRLSRTLQLVGIGKLVLGGLTLVLAFTGYETPRPLNLTLFIIGINLLVLGWLCLSVGKSFGLASGSAASGALAEALQKANKLFGYYLVLIVLGVVGVGFDTATFLGKLLSR